MRKVFRILIIFSLCFCIVGSSNGNDVAENQDEADEIIESTYCVDEKTCMEPWDGYTVYKTMESRVWSFICNDAYIEATVQHNSEKNTHDIINIIYHGKDYKVQATIYGSIDDKDEESTNDLKNG